MGLGFGVWGLGFRVLGSRVQGSECRVWGSGFGVQGLGFGVWDLAPHTAPSAPPPISARLSASCHARVLERVSSIKSVPGHDLHF